MCTSWTDQQWEQNSRPADATAIYTMEDTRYNANGEVARTYSSTAGSWYGVLPGLGNHPRTGYGEEGHTAALSFLATNGYTLTENPLATPIPAGHPALVAPDLVEQFA